MNEPNSLVVKHLALNVATGTNQIVAAVTGRAIRVVALEVVLIGGYFRTASGGAALTGTLATGLPMVLPYLSDGWFQTNTGEALYATSPSVQIQGSLTYVEV